MHVYYVSTIMGPNAHSNYLIRTDGGGWRMRKQVTMIPETFCVVIQNTVHACELYSDFKKKTIAMPNLIKYS